MGNCLVTKLKEVVQNNSLLKIGEFKVNVKAGTITNAQGAQQVMEIAGPADTTIRVLGNVGYFAESYADLDIPSSRLTSISIGESQYRKLYFSNDNYDIAISNKENITSIIISGKSASQRGILSMNINDIKYNTVISDIECSFTNTVGNLDSLNNKHLQYFIAENTGISGSFINFAESSSYLKTLKITNCNINGTIECLNNSSIVGLDVQGTNVSGDIGTLTLTRLQYIWGDNTQLEGSVNTLASNINTAGATREIINISGNNTEMKANGEYFHSCNIQFSAGSYSVIITS